MPVAKKHGQLNDAQRERREASLTSAREIHDSCVRSRDYIYVHLLPRLDGPFHGLVVNRLHGTLALLGEGGDTLSFLPVPHVLTGALEAM